jgi:hypothetical protein
MFLSFIVCNISAQNSIFSNVVKDFSSKIRSQLKFILSYTAFFSISASDSFISLSVNHHDVIIVSKFDIFM